MNHAVYRLTCQGYTNFIVSTKEPQHNCRITQMGPKTTKKAAHGFLSIHSGGGLGHRAYNASEFEWEGGRYKSQRGLAMAIGIPTNTLAMRLHKYRTWLIPWPDDLFELICERRVPHLRFRRRRRKYVLC